MTTPNTPRARPAPGRPALYGAPMVRAPQAYIPQAARAFFEQLGGGNYAAGLRAAWVILSAPAQQNPPPDEREIPY